MATNKTPQTPANDGTTKAKTPSSQTTKDDLRGEIAALRDQLASVRMERRMLIETVHSLSRTMGAYRKPLPSEGVGSTESDEALAGPRSFGLRSREAGRACNITKTNIDAIVYGAIFALDHDAPTTMTDATKLGQGGLGWDDETKQLIFNPIRDGVDRHGCHLGTTAIELATKKTVGEVIDLVNSRVLRTA